jgi:hypothetical protein
MRYALSIAVLLLATSEAYAQPVDVPYDKWAQGVQALLDEVSEAKKLTHSQARVAERIAGYWVYLGPCRGTRDKVDSSRAAEAIQATADPDPRRPLDSAILEMIALINLADLGRGGSEYACQFALSKVNRLSPPDPAPAGN